MQSHPTTLSLVAQTRIADRQREASAVRLADFADASAPRVSLRGWLATRLRKTGDNSLSRQLTLVIRGGVSSWGM